MSKQNEADIGLIKCFHTNSSLHEFMENPLLPPYAFFLDREEAIKTQKFTGFPFEIYYIDAAQKLIRPNPEQVSDFPVYIMSYRLLPETKFPENLVHMPISRSNLFEGLERMYRAYQRILAQSEEPTGEMPVFNPENPPGPK